MMRRAVIFFFLVSLTGSVRAMLPADASAREPQIRAYRQQIREKYEKRQIERQAESARAYEQTRADIFTPPWLRGGKETGAETGIGSLSGGKMEQEPKRNHRLLISIMLLILISSVAGWAHYATRKQDK